MLVGLNCRQRSQQLNTDRGKQQLRRHVDVLETLANQNQVLNGPKLYKLKENFIRRFLNILLSIEVTIVTVNLCIT